MDDKFNGNGIGSLQFSSDFRKDEKLKGRCLECGSNLMLKKT